MSEHTEDERREAEEFLKENDDLFSLLADRLGGCVTAGDSRKLSFFVCQIGSYCTLALNLMSRVKAAEKAAGNA